jgi:hypothetical protein
MTPQAKGRFMAKTYNYKDEFVRANCSFRGWKKCWLFRVFPYITEQSPKLLLNVHLKNQECEVIGIEIGCEDPLKKPDQFYNSVNYGWFADEVKTDFDYKIDLPDLLSGGCEYRYDLAIRIKYPYKGTQQEMSICKTIMTTGYVLYQGKVVIGIILALLPIIGSCLTLLIQWLMALSANGG